MLHSGKILAETPGFSIAVLLCLAAVLNALMFRIFNTENIDAFIQKTFLPMAAKSNTMPISAENGCRAYAYFKRSKPFIFRTRHADAEHCRIQMGFWLEQPWSDAPIIENGFFLIRR